jgi:hypothetical protein
MRHALLDDVLLVWTTKAETDEFISMGQLLRNGDRGR